MEDISAELTDVFAEGVDAAIELAEGIPFVGHALKLANFYRSVRDALFIRQVRKFLAEINTAPEAARRRFIEDLQANGEAERFGETIVLLIAQLDSIEKPVIIGRLYAAAILGQIELQEAERLSGMVSRLYLGDLPVLELLNEASFIHDDMIHATLAALGLVRRIEVQQSAFAVIGNTEGGRYERSRFGDMLVKFGLNGIAWNAVG